LFADQLRAAIIAAPRCDLAKVGEALWKAWGRGLVTDDEAQALSEAIEAKRAIIAAPKPAQRRLGSRPRSPGSMERRRRWAASGCLPPQIAARFTLAETAVLAVIAAEHVRHGACTLTVPHIAALAGVSETTVRNAVRQARRLGFLHVETRRVSAWRNLPNRLTIPSKEWAAWLRMRRRGEGANSCPPRIREDKKGTPAQRNQTWAAERQGVGRERYKREESQPPVRSTVVT
jgi:predicted transcriptional regulator